MRRGLLPALLFLLAAGGVLLLGTRILASERSSAERTARERLRGRLEFKAGILQKQAARLTAELRDLDIPFPVRSAEGRFSRPRETEPFARLRDWPEMDPEADFYLAEGERSETRDGDPPRARALYQSAAAPGSKPGHRLEALFRLAALARRQGDDAAAAAHERAFLDLVDPSRAATLESLIIRIRRGEQGRTLAEDLLVRHDPSDPGRAVVPGLLRMAGVSAELIRAREGDLAFMARVRSLGAPGTAAEGVALAGTWPPGYRQSRVDRPMVVAWATLGDGSVRYASEVLSLLDSNFGLVGAPRGAAPADRVEEVGEAGACGISGVQLVAWSSRQEVESEARRGAWMLGGALAALLLAGGAALVLSLRAARRETEAARARADFVTKVGHDLRTPLAVVRMYAETLAAGKVADPAEAREFAAVAAREAGRLTGMVDQVLDLSRVAESVLPRVPLDLASLAAEVAAVHRPLLDRAGIRLEVRCAGPLPVLGDSAALRGAVSNLLENAGRHGASGGSVEIEAAREGTMAVVRVLDRGPGIPAGMEERIFERFVRGPGAAGSGAGLGLALVREAAVAHGGGAAASNREGGGAVFALDVPLAEGEA